MNELTDPAWIDGVRYIAAVPVFMLGGTAANLGGQFLAWTDRRRGR